MIASETLATTVGLVSSEELPTQDASISIGGACLARSTSARDGTALQGAATRHLVKARAQGTGGIDIHPAPIEPGK